MDIINLIGCAAGAASNNSDCKLGPEYLRQHPELFHAQGIKSNWLNLLKLESLEQGLAVFPELNICFTELAHELIRRQHHDNLVVVGGDHSMAMGTWSGVMTHHPNLGLMWVDAHMDSHSPSSSLTKNIHGMPLSYLLGIWEYPGFEPIHPRPYLKPENLVLVGVRSYDSAEYTYLHSLGVKIFFMEDILQRGLSSILSEAMDILQPNLRPLGLSIDLDGFDPKDCPGVGYRVKDGLDLSEFLNFFRSLNFKSWLALEITEFNPLRDIENKTAKAIVDIIKAVYY